MVRRLAAIGRGLAVVDPMQRRITLLDDKLAYRRSWLVEAQPRAVALLSNGGLVVNLIDYAPSRVTPPFAVLSSTGSHQEFGPRAPTAAPYAGWRVLAASRSGGFWAAPFTEYRVAKWSADGQRLAWITREADWFEPHARRVDFDPDKPPPPTLRAMQERDDGTLWVVIQVADSNWRKALRWDARHPDGARYVPTNLNDYLDTVIELIDPVRMRSIVAARIPRIVLGFSAPDEVFMSRLAESGVPEATIYSLSVTREKN